MLSVYGSFVCMIRLPHRLLSSHPLHVQNDLWMDTLLQETQCMHACLCAFITTVKHKESITQSPLLFTLISLMYSINYLYCFLYRDTDWQVRSWPHSPPLLPLHSGSTGHSCRSSSVAHLNCHAQSTWTHPGVHLWWQLHQHLPWEGAFIPDTSSHCWLR